MSLELSESSLGRNRHRVEPWTLLEGGVSLAALSAPASPSVPAVARMVPLVAMAGPLVRMRPLGPLLPVVMALLLVLPRVGRGPLPRAAPGPGGASAARLPGLGGGVLVAPGLLVTPQLGALVTGAAVVELPRGRVAPTPGAAVGFGTARGGVALALPPLWGWRSRG